MSLSLHFGGILCLTWGLKPSYRLHLRPLQRLQWFQSLAAYFIFKKIKYVSSGLVKVFKRKLIFLFPCSVSEGGVGEWSRRE